MTDRRDSHELRYEVLGSLGIGGKTGEISITRPGYRRVLSWLLLEGGRPLDRDVLIERLWPERVPPTAANTIQHYIAGLRRFLGRDSIRTVSRGYEIDLTDAWLDSEEFDLLSDLTHRASRDGYVDRAVSFADSALALWRGAPFQELDDSEGAAPEIRRLERVRQQIEEVRLASLIDMGQPELAIPDLEALVLSDPLSERFWELLMMARYRMGEQAEALRAFQEASRVLRDQVGLDPGPGLVLMEQQILLHDPTLTDVIVPRRTNLPPAESELMGRSADLETLRELLKAGPVVTITGPPGMGKTHLSVETARSMLGDFEDGVWLVSLRSESTMKDVTRAFAEGVGADTGTDLERLLAHLRHLNILVVMDNAEHVAAECRRILAEALKGANGLRFLITSRAPIGVSAEIVWRLRGLDTAASSSGVLSPAAELLVGRVQMVEPAFRVTSANASRLNEIAAKADGVPLVMVLMASWLPAVGLDEVANLIQPAETDVETHPGPTMIEAALEWSYRLLPPGDVEHFNDLSIFVASFDLDAAHAVVNPTVGRRGMIGVLTRLVEASLLETIRANDGALRYRMLLPIRDHAIRQLMQSGGLNRVRDAYFSVHRDRALAFAAACTGMAGIVLGPVDQDIGDYRAVMQGALDEGRPEVTADIAAGLTEYWFARFLSVEGSEWLDLAERSETGAATALHSWAAGFLAYLDDDGAAARDHYSRALQAAGASGDEGMRSRALFGLGRAQLFEADGLEGADRIEEAIHIWSNDPATLRTQAEAHLLLGMRATRLGAERDDHLVAAATILSELQDPSLASSLARYESLAAWNRGEFASAVELAEDSVSEARAAHDAPKLCGALSQLCLARCGYGDTVGAANALLEGLDIVKDGNLADTAQVLAGGIGLLLSTNHESEAASTLAMLDEQYERRGVGSVDFDLAAARRWRLELADSQPGPWLGSDLVEHIRHVLTGIAGAP
ncbi:MAG: BTAD domain-containing putative transcriptional regulator [Actinomycetota bacterium]|nr:BTAD domain-containing putative transcriptional regulator [Actinomycetota bacterium]